MDVVQVAQTLGKEPGVVYAAEYPYMCSEAGQNLVMEAIREHRLTGVVICSCSPRMHEATFRKAVSRAGLNPYMLEIANIREQCSWIHKSKEEATEKAVILGRAAIAKVQLNACLLYTSDPHTGLGGQWRKRSRATPHSFRNALAGRHTTHRSIEIASSGMDP